MFDGRFETTSERLRHVSGGCITAFADLTANLDAVRRSSAEISGQLSGLQGLVDAQSMDDDLFARLAGRVSALQHSLQVSAKAGFPGQEGGELQIALRHLGTIGRETKMLMAIASLTRVVAAEHNDADLEDYVENLRDLALRIAQGAGTTQEALDQSLREVRAGRAAIRAAAVAVQHLYRELSGGTGQRARLANDLTVTSRHLAQVAASFPDAARSGLNMLIEAIQFADIFGQRLAHVPMLMARAQGRERAVHQLTRAQMTAAVEDMTAVLSQTETALAKLQDLGSGALALFSGGGDPASANGFFDRRRSDLARVEAVSAEAGVACQGAVDTSARVLDRIDAATRQIVSLDEDTYAIGLSALNAMLLTGRGGRSRVSLKVLSDAVRSSATVCADACIASGQGLARLAHSDATAALDGIGEDFAEFRAAILATRTELDRAGAVQQQMDDLQSRATAAFVRLVAATKAGSEAAARLRGTVEALQAALPPLSPADGLEPPTADALSDLMEVYTMAREREVHEALCGAGSLPAVVKADMARQTDLADILF